MTTFTARAAAIDQALRDSMPLAISALMLGAIAVLLRTTRRDWALPAASLSLLLAAVPASLQGTPQFSTAVLGAALAAPVGGLAFRSPLPVAVRAALAVALGGFLLAWADARLSGNSRIGDLEAVRSTVAAFAVLLVVVKSSLRTALEDRPLNIVRPRPIDLIVISAGGLGALSLVATDVVSPVGIWIAALVAIGLLPLLRAQVAARLGRSLLGDLRNEARAQGANDERARLAHELHDDHLQELVGVIRRLEVKPGTEAEQDDLRDLATRLRDVASSLRPPVLDDFGLLAALEYLAEARGGVWSIQIDVVNRAGLDRASRPPEDVELAVYRILAEAIGNAVKHAKASRIVITGWVEPDAVVLQVEDDGIGVSDTSLRAALTRNRLGVASMRRRASSIDADFSITGTDKGTAVRVAWHR